ncbi:uncharacterized protein PAC_14959 [Phialocephala subalpina]|uniref:C2H2-type domain-containing protein n=1 Tax=Phialocephala subalpina TaxID=576137 RepID=A0A1L7XJ39_9HELO|nr:uncharacterized protein PAC_14959 [Phialocephala subalpina]
MAAVRKWHDSELVGLVAWVDICKKRKFNFDDTVVEHLRNVTKGNAGDGHEFTLIAIKAKLVDSQDPNSDQLLANQILAKGSGCFRSFVAEHHDAFKEALHTYGVITQSKEKKKQEGRRVMSKTPEGGPTTKTPHSDIHRGSEGKFHGRKGRTGNGLAADGSIKKQVLQTQSSHSTEPTANGPKGDGRTTRQSNAASASQKASKTTNTQMPYIHRPSDQLAAQVERLQVALKWKDAHIGILRAQWQAEVEAAHILETRLKATEAELRAEISLLKVAQQEREQAGKDPLESALFKKNHDIWDLTQRLMKMQKLHSFAERDVLHKSSMEHRVAGEALDRIADDLKFMLNGHDLTRLLDIPKIEENSDLGCLVRSIFGQGNLEISADHTTRMKQSVAKFGAGPVLRTFCVCAIGEWVFNSNFPNFVPNKARLLQAYREAVMGHDGWTRLRNLEMAAYSTLINGEHFQQKIIPKKAEDLAVRLSRALAPFFAADVNGTEQEGFETWGEAKIVWEDRKFRMTEIFEGALRLKAATVTTDQVFDFVVNMPGSIERNAAADCQIRSNGSMPPSNMRTHDEFYELASFHIYPGKASAPRDLMADALVQSRNFVDKAIFTRSDKPLYTKCVHIQNLDCVLSPEGFAVDLDTETPTEDRLRTDDGESQVLQPAKEASPVSSGPAVSAQNIDDDLLFKCHICQRRFKVKQSLNRHEKNDECAHCMDCGIFFAKAVDLRRHQKIEHDHQRSAKYDEKRRKRKAPTVVIDTSDGSDQSDEYDSSSESQVSPRKKLKTNKYPKNHACNKCHQQFSHPKGLERHMLSDHATVIEDSPESADTVLHGDNTRKNTGDAQNVPVKDSFANFTTQERHEQDHHTS